MDKFTCEGKYVSNYTKEGHLSVKIQGEIQIPLEPDDIKNWCSFCQNADVLKQIIATCRHQILLLSENDNDDFRSRA